MNEKEISFTKEVLRNESDSYHAYISIFIESCKNILFYCKVQWFSTGFYMIPGGPHEIFFSDSCKQTSKLGVHDYIFVVGEKILLWTYLLQEITKFGKVMTLLKNTLYSERKCNCMSLLFLHFTLLNLVLAVYNSQSKACNKLDIVQRGDNVGIKYHKTCRVALTTRFALNKVALN